uniref:Uncharacterized protein n=1 Tax=Arundo donax TaxID=35708 RepID=A0A0A9FGL5_ARUDO
MQKDDSLARTYYGETIFPCMIAEILFCDLAPFAIHDGH